MPISASWVGDEPVYLVRAAAVAVLGEREGGRHGHLSRAPLASRTRPGRPASSRAPKAWGTGCVHASRLSASTWRGLVRRTRHVQRWAASWPVTVPTWVRHWTGCGPPTRTCSGWNPDFAALRAMCVAWGEETLGQVHQVSCEDPLTGLATQGHLLARLEEIYRGAEQHDASPSESHALVVVGQAASAPRAHRPTRGQLGGSSGTVRPCPRPGAAGIDDPLGLPGRGVDRPGRARPAGGRRTPRRGPGPPGRRCCASSSGGRPRTPEGAGLDRGPSRGLRSGRAAPRRALPPLDTRGVGPRH